MKHHFVPVFYLKHFTLDDGFFYIFDVTRNKFKKNGQKFSPDSHFYLVNLNTVYNGLEKTEFVETAFSKHDNAISKIVDKIAQDESNQLTPHEWTYLQYFINILYWRNPSATAQLTKLIGEAQNLSPFGMSMRNTTTGQRLTDEEERRWTLDNPEFVKYLRLSISGSTYPQVFAKTEQDHVTIITFPPGLPKLVSDNPVIYLNEEGESLHTAPLIFPITPTKVLFRHLRPNLTLINGIRVMIDMILFAQATNYVSCTDHRYPALLSAAYNEKYTSVQPLKHKLAQLLK